jgi:CubicO group peptidase (beta-lactamase class C family)
MKKSISVTLAVSFIVLLSFAGSGQYVARHNMSSSDYQAAFNTFSGTQKMRLADVSVYNRNGQETYAAIWDKKSSAGWSARHAMNESGYQSEVIKQKQAGLRPGRITAADINGKLVFACIYYKISGAWEARHNLSSQQYQTEYNNWVGKGYRLVEVCGYKRNGQETYAAVWEKSTGPQYVARHAMSAQKYQDEFNTHYANGYKPVRVSAFEVGGQSRFAAIFEKMNDGVYARSGLNENNYQAEVDNGWYLGSALKHVCGYYVNGKVHFSALWMGAGLSGNDQNLINNKVKKYMDDFNVPGLSIAVMKDGKLVFARGYGQSDKSNGNMVSPNSLFRIASVSKPITSTAIMRLTETTNLKLSDKLFGPGGILGDVCAGSSNNCIDKTDAEKITVQSCLEHSTGWTNDAVWDQYQLNNADITKWALKNYSQGTAPGANYTYINFDFFLLGRVIEKKSGQSYENYVKNSILAKCGVTKMRIGSDAASGKAPGEVTYYPDNNNGDPYALKLTRMDANGGWIARPIDLLMFAAGIDGLNNRPDVINSGTLTTMRTVSTAANAGNYAKGIMVKGDLWKHNGCMSGTLSELSHFSNGISVAMSINTRPNNDQCTGNGLYPLMKDIAESSVVWPGYDLF